MRLVAPLVARAAGTRSYGLMPPAYVKPYVKRQKNDATDAEAICEAVTRVHSGQRRALARLSFVAF